MNLILASGSDAWSLNHNKTSTLNWVRNALLCKGIPVRCLHLEPNPGPIEVHSKFLGISIWPLDPCAGSTVYAFL